MSIICLALGCRNRAQANSRVHFFRFPLKNPERLKLWIKAVGQKGFVPTRSSRLCSEHFLHSDFDHKVDGSYNLMLKRDAVPSIFPSSIHSTLIPTKLFCTEPPKKKLKNDNLTTASSRITSETDESNENVVVAEVDSTPTLIKQSTSTFITTETSKLLCSKF